MKKLLLVVVASFFSCTVYAQIETSATPNNDFGPRELKCTEEAISFRVNIRPGLQLSSLRPGYTDFDNSLSGFTLSKNYAGEDMISEPVQLVIRENAFSRQDSYSNTNFLFPEKMVKSLVQTSLFANDRFFYDYYNSLQLSNFNLLVPK